MKFVHLADLHFGKLLYEYSLLDDQRYIFEKILQIIDGVSPDAVVLAGDIYDKSIPSAEAVQVCDWFLSALAKRNIPIFIISGNHDSAERIAFGAKLMKASKIHIAPVYNGKILPIPLSDEYGTVNFYLLPFIKPAHLRKAFPDAKIETYTDAVQKAIEEMKVDTSVRNVLVTHQYYVDSVRYQNEDISVGGSDEVDACVLEPFDYAALGHIHAQGNVTEKARYCGSPLKYAFSAAKQSKDITVVHLGEKGDCHIELIPLVPYRDMVELKGDFLTLSSKAYYQNIDTDRYVHITLTDEQDVPNGLTVLRNCYPYLMKLDYDNTRTRQNQEIGSIEQVEKKTPLALFSALYELQNNTAMSEKQQSFMEDLIRSIWEEDV